MKTKSTGKKLKVYQLYFLFRLILDVFAFDGRGSTIKAS